MGSCGGLSRGGSCEPGQKMMACDYVLEAESTLCMEGLDVMGVGKGGIENN